jgi:hypothetical protein
LIVAARSSKDISKWLASPADSFPRSFVQKEGDTQIGIPNDPTLAKLEPFKETDPTGLNALIQSCQV